MLSDLAPLEMSAPEPADARPSAERSAESAATGSAAACTKQRGRRRQRSSRQAAETKRRLLAPFPRQHTSHASSFHRSASAPVQLLPRLSEPLQRPRQSPRRRHGDDDDDGDGGGKSRKQSRPKCPIIALVNHVRGDEAQRDTQRGGGAWGGGLCQSALIHQAHKHILPLPGESAAAAACSSTYLEPLRSQAESEES